MNGANWRRGEQREVKSLSNANKKDVIIVKLRAW